MTHTEQFDAAIQRVTQDNAVAYGHPLAGFLTASAIKTAVAGCPDAAVRHALEMIAVKMARLAHSPDHLDSAIDIAGYARTICMIVDERRVRNETEKADVDGR